MLRCANGQVLNAACQPAKSGCDQRGTLLKTPEDLSEGQRAYEAKRAAKAGMSLEKWLASKQRQQEAEARAREKAAEPAKADQEAGPVRPPAGARAQAAVAPRHVACAQRSSRMRTGASIRASAGSPSLGATRAYGGWRRRNRWARWQHSSPGCAPPPPAARWRSGVDLPIGLPRAYAAGLPERDFLHFLTTIATRPEFFQVCATLAEVGPDRPFYPARGVRGMTRAAHAAALGLDGAAALSRACDRATAERPAGAPLFWTLGANQAGKAAIAAWQAMLLPALAGGEDVRLWPFAGAYPDAVGAGRGGAGRDLSGRGAAPSRHAAQGQQAPAGGPGGRRRSSLPARWPPGRCCPIRELRQAIADGFGGDAAGEDRFDCILGVLCVLNVLAGNRPDTAPADPWIRRWEGWVLGQTALPAEKRWRAPQDAPKVAFGNDQPLTWIRSNLTSRKNA